MQVEFGDDNRFKKRVTKNMKKNFAVDQGFAPSLGSTVPDSNAFNNLLSVCEDIETKAQLVSNQLERDDISKAQHQNEFLPPQGIVAFYASVKMGVSALKKASFKNLPKSDIASLQSYKDRLDVFKESFKAKFAELQITFDKNGGPIPDEATLNKNKSDAIDDIGQIDKAINDLFRDYNRTARPTLKQTTEYNFTRDQMLEAKQRRESDSHQAERALVDATKTVGSKAEKGQLIEKDMALVLPLFETFLSSLGTGLQSYASGISGKNSIVGGYALHMGAAEYLPRRFM